MLHPLLANRAVEALEPNTCVGPLGCSFVLDASNVHNVFARTLHFYTRRLCKRFNVADRAILLKGPLAANVEGGRFQIRTKR